MKAVESVAHRSYQGGTSLPAPGFDACRQGSKELRLTERRQYTQAARMRDDQFDIPGWTVAACNLR